MTVKWMRSECLDVVLVCVALSVNVDGVFPAARSADRVITAILCAGPLCCVLVTVSRGCAAGTGTTV